MMFVKAVLLLNIVLMLQVDAFPSNFEENSTVNKLINHIRGIFHQEVRDEDLQALSSLNMESHGSLDQFLLSAKATVNKIQQCEPEIKLELLKQIALKGWNPKECINATIDIADFETLFLRIYDFLVKFDQNAVNVTKAVIECRHEENIFEILKCIITAIQEDGSECDSLLNELKSLINQFEIELRKFIEDVKKCFGMSKTELFSQVLHILKNKC